MMKLIFMFFLLIVHLSSGYDVEENVALLDYDSSTGNLLFRSGADNLKKGNSFPYDDFVSLFRQVAQDMNVPFPDEFYLVDLSLLTVETSEIEKEKSFFQKNPTLGEYRDYAASWFSGDVEDAFVAACNKVGADHCSGSNALPDNYDEKYVSQLAREYMDWSADLQLEQKLSATYDLIHKPSTQGKTIVAFVHCNCGCDRSGSFAGSYMMKYQQVNFTTAMKINDYIADRLIHFDDQVQLEWYCEYLFYTGQYSSQTNDCASCDLFRCDPNASENVKKTYTFDFAKLRLWEKSSDSKTGESQLSSSIVSSPSSNPSRRIRMSDSPSASLRRVKKARTTGGIGRRTTN